MTDFKGLCGDISDSLPGVPGIGAKTASALLAKYDSIEGVFNNLWQIFPAIYQKLRSHQSSALLSKQLATLERNLSLEPYTLKSFAQPGAGK